MNPSGYVSFRNTLAIGLLVLLSSFCLPAWSRQNLLILGDSLGAGHGVPLDQRWSHLLQQRLDQRYPGHWQVVNASIGGETTDGGLRRLPGLLKRHQPAIVLIELGGNDGLRGFPIAVTRKNLAAMIQDSRKAGAQPVLIGIRLPPNYGPQYTDAFAGIYAQLAQKYQIPEVPFLLAKVYDEPGMMQQDGIHPTTKAQPALLRTVWKTLGPVIAKTTRHEQGAKAK